MLTKPVDDLIDATEWRGFLRANDFGQVVAPGRDLAMPVVTPLHFAFLDGDVLERAQLVVLQINVRSLHHDIITL